MPKPCPFCGAQLTRAMNGWQHPPVEPRCYAQAHIGGKMIDAWDKRAAPVVRYDVEGGLPVFRPTGAFTATEEQLTQFFQWYNNNSMSKKELEK